MIEKIDALIFCTHRVENIILKIPVVKDVFIYKESNQIIGNIVCADVHLNSVTEDRDKIKKDINSFCLKHLEPYKIPIKINFVQNRVHTSRYKKKRNWVLDESIYQQLIKMIIRI